MSRPLARQAGLTIALGALLALAGCDGSNPVAVRLTDNPNVPADLLFTVDGCRVYRFMDDGHFHYFATCTGTVSTEYTYGRGQHYSEDLPTVGTPK